MPDPLILDTPTNAEPRATNLEVTTLAAGVMRKIRVPKDTGSVQLTVVDSGGSPMAFRIQGVGVDGEAQTTGYPLAAGSHDVYNLAGGGDPTRGQYDGDSWTFLVAGDEASPTFHFLSGLHI